MSAGIREHPLRTGVPPPWSDAWGEDEFGVWAGFSVEGVECRMRWIPEGSFWMGSPEQEPGRSSGEGPQHRVVLSKGYWLAEFPCTQDLWEAVLGENPSRFRDSRRPVEQVSHHDCERFLDRLNELVPELEARLPSEAEWEYACRADEEGGPYQGGFEIPGLNDAAELHPVAWYAGNSGVEFDLEDGVDSSGWTAKQFEHTRAGTRRVGLKAPNGWGLYDMLGNVYEWCQDDPRHYSSETAVDPIGAGPGRAVRGGSWNSYARYVRPASRLASPREFANVSLGFRLARGLRSRPESAEPTPGGQAAATASAGTAGPERRGERPQTEKQA